MLNEDLKDRLMAVHLANASDTNRPLHDPYDDPDDLGTAKGMLRGVVYSVLVWTIVAAVYLMLTAGG